MLLRSRRRSGAPGQLACCVVSSCIAVLLAVAQWQYAPLAYRPHGAHSTYRVDASSSSHACNCSVVLANLTGLAATCAAATAVPSCGPCPALISTPCPATSTAQEQQALTGVARQPFDARMTPDSLLVAAANVVENYELLGCSDMNTGCARPMLHRSIRSELSGTVGFDASSSSEVWLLREADAHHNGEFVVRNVKIVGTTVHVRWNCVS